MKSSSKATPQDIAYSAVQAVVGSVPIIGAAASEILGLIVAPPLEKRRSKLFTEIGLRLKALEEADRIDLNTLTGDQKFIDTVLQATVLALKTSDEEKLKAFKNVIINSALPDSPDKIITQIFLNLIDNFTSWHIKILQLIDDPQGWFRTNNKTFPNYISAGLIVVLTEAYPELKGQNELMNIIWADLRRAGLHNSGDLGAMMTGNGLLAERTTDLGKDFLRFIEVT